MPGLMDEIDAALAGEPPKPRGIMDEIDIALGEFGKPSLETQRGLQDIEGAAKTLAAQQNPADIYPDSNGFMQNDVGEQVPAHEYRRSQLGYEGYQGFLKQSGKQWNDTEAEAFKSAYDTAQQEKARRDYESKWKLEQKRRVEGLFGIPSQHYALAKERVDLHPVYDKERIQEIDAALAEFPKPDLVKMALDSNNYSKANIIAQRIADQEAVLANPDSEAGKAARVRQDEEWRKREAARLYREKDADLFKRRKEKEFQGWNEFSRVVGASLGKQKIGMQSLLSRAISLISGDEDYSQYADQLNELRSSAGAAQAKLSENKSNLLPPRVSHLISNSTESAANMILAAPGGPAAMALLSGADQANQSYSEAKNAGLEGSEARAYALRAGLIEAGVTLLMNKLVGAGVEGEVAAALKPRAVKEITTTLLKRAGKASLEELPEEGIITLLQTINEQKINPQALNELPDRLLDTALQTIFMSGSVSSVTTASDWVRKNPDAAKAFAESNGSRTALDEAKAAGLPVPDGKLNAEAREKLRLAVADLHAQSTLSEDQANQPSMPTERMPEPQQSAPATVEGAQTFSLDQITGGKPKETVPNREARRSELEQGMQGQTLDDQIREKFGDQRPNRAQVMEAFKLEREEAGQALKRVYGEAVPTPAKVEPPAAQPAPVEAHKAEPPVMAKEDLNAMTVFEVKEIANSLGIKSKGTKGAMIQQIQEQRAAIQKGNEALLKRDPATWDIMEIKQLAKSMDIKSPGTKAGLLKRVQDALAKKQAVAKPETARERVARVRNLLENKTYEEMSPSELLDVARSNPLTGLLNRKSYNDEVKARRKAGQPVSEAMLDGNGLKWVNDNLGHEAGNELLKSMASLGEDTGVSLYHWGGDEFSSHGASDAELSKKMENLKKAANDVKIRGQAGGLLYEFSPEFEYGVGKDLKSADTTVNDIKKSRPRGQPPSSLRVISGRPEGVVGETIARAAQYHQVDSHVQGEAAGLVTPAAKPAPVIKPIKSALDITHVQDAFPGRPVVNHEGGYLVRLAGGGVVRIAQADIKNVKLATLERTIGAPTLGKLFGSDYAKHVDHSGNFTHPLFHVQGEFELKFGDSTKTTPLGIIRLADPDAKTLKHEQLHLARNLGLMTPGEFNALRKKYAPDAPESQVEERVAEGIANWQDTVLGKIQNFIGKLLEPIWGKNGEQVVRSMQTGAFWNRAETVTQSQTQHRIGVKGRPDLANIFTDKASREFMNQVDAARTQRGEPTVRHDADVNAKADELLKTDYAQAKRNMVEVGQLGRGLAYDHEVVAAKKILNKEVPEALRTNDAKQLADAVALVDAYRNMGTEQARAFRQRRDPAETPEQRMQRSVMEAVLTPPNKSKQAIDDARKSGDLEALRREHEKWAKEIQELKKKLSPLGVDLNQIQNLKDPVTAARALGAVSAAKADGWDAAYEYWRNSILSGPQTQATNISSNLTHFFFYNMVERPIEATLNGITGNKDGAQWGEMRYVWKGMLPGIANGFKNALRTWNSETPYFEHELGRDGTSKIEGANVAIEGEKGRFVRIPQRTLSAVDEFGKTLTATTEGTGAQAYRIAKKEGLSGEALSRRIEELVSNTHSPAWDKAVSEARRMTFTEDGGFIAKGFAQLRKNVPSMRYVIPFINTPVNVVKQGAQGAPIIGTLHMGYKMYQASKTGNWDGISHYMAKQFIGCAVALAILSTNDDEDPWITGAVSKVPGSAALSQRARPAMSIRIGDKWYSYARIEPFATTLALTVDMINGLKSGEASKMAGAIPSSLLGQLSSKTFLSGFADVVEIINKRDADSAAKWASNFTTSWVPNVVRAPLRNADDELAERSVWGKGPEWTSRLLRRTLQKTELGIVPDQPKVDLWGREIQRSPNSDIGWKLLRQVAPTNVQSAEVFTGDRALLNWNAQHPEDEKFPSAPDKYYKAADGSTKYMSDEQYHQYCKLAGELARKVVGNEIKNPDNPTRGDIESLDNAIAQSQRKAREMLVQSWSGKKSELDVDKLAVEVQEDRIAHYARVMSASFPKEPKDGKTVKELQDEHLKKIKSAVEWLKGREITPANALQALLKDSARSGAIKTASARESLKSRFRQQVWRMKQ